MRLEDLQGLTQDQQFKAAASNAGVPESVLRNMWSAESANGTNLGPSKAGAVGHFQQMPKTLASLETRFGRKFDPNDFTQGLFMASELMKENMQHFGTVDKAVQAYNGGWDESRWNNEETQGYVKKVLNTGDQPVETFNVRGEDLRTQMFADQLQRREAVAPTAKAQLTPNEKAALMIGASGALAEGQTESDVTKLVAAAKTQPEEVVTAALPVGQQPVQPDYSTADSVLDQQLAADRQRQEQAENRTYGETLRAALNEFSVTNNIMRNIAMTTARDTDAARVDDTGWQKNYIENRSEFIKGLSPNGIREADGARNQSEFDTIKADDLEQQKYQQVLSDSEHPILWGIAGTVLDPVSLGAGVVTDGLFTAGRAAALAGRMAQVAPEVLSTLPARAAVGTAANYVTRGAVTGAATNLEITGMLDALGKQTTISDYMHSVAAGLGLGILGGAVAHGLSKLDIADLLKLQRQTHDNAAAETVANLEAAKAAAGQAMGPELAALAKQQASQRVIDDVNHLTAPVDTGNKPFGQSKPDVIANANKGMEQGIDLISDEEKFNSITGLYLDADKWNAAHPEINARLNKVAEAVNIRGKVGLQSTGSQLRTDANPLARMLGVEIAEDAGGESGYRVMTASIDSKIRHAGYMNGFEHALMENFHDWASHHGFGRAAATADTFTSGTLWKRYMEEVATEIRARARDDYTPSAHQAVIRAANRTEIGFKKMADDQKLNGTLGNEFIPDSSVGYLPQQLNGAALNKLSLSERQRVIAAFEEQARKEFGWDGEFAMQKVREYMKRAEDYATSVGGMTPPAPKGLKQIALDELYDKFAAGNLTREQLIAGVERLRKGAGKHTGKRLGWDLTQLIQRDDGTLMPLSDLYVNDVVELYRSYANRVAGDVAFARKGLLGDRDIDLVTEALRSSKVGNPLETVPAWQQLVAEIYNRPVSRDAHGAAGKILRPIRQFTNLRLLGGTVFPQLAETANIMTHMGVVSTMGIVQKIPRLASELALIKRGIIPENSILASVDRVVGAPLGVEDFQFVLPRVFDDATGILDGYSMGTMNRIIAGGQMIHQKFSFMRAATAVQKRFVAEEIVAKSLRFMREGIEEAALKDMGFSPELMSKLKAHMDEFVKFDDRGYAVAFDAGAMPRELQADYIAAVYRGTNQIIQGTFPGETGKWMRTELSQTLFQLRRFPAVAIEKQMARQFRNLGTARSLGGIVAAMGLGTLIYMGRAQIAASLMPESQKKKYLDERLSIGNIAAGATTYVSALGMTTDVMNLFSGAAHMANDNWNLGMWNSRGVPAQGLGTLVPGLGTVDDLYNLSQNPSAKGAMQLLPFSNLPMVLPLINMAKGHMAEDDN